MIKASVLLAFTYCTMFFLRRRPAAERHMLWAMAIGAAALLSLLTVGLPSWQPNLVTRMVGVFPEVLRVADPQGGRGQSAAHALGIESGFSILKIALAPIWIAGSFVASFTLL